jgi:hypothetical protein
MGPTASLGVNWKIKKSVDTAINPVFGYPIGGIVTILSEISRF